MKRIAISILFTSLVITGCSKGGDAGGGGSKPAAVKLAKLGVELDLPGEVSPGDGLGDDSIMITGSDIGAMDVDLAKTPQSVEDAKSDANMFTPKNLKVDTLPDGYAITFDNKGDMGANFFVDVQRTIGGKAYKCATTTNTAERQAAVLAACKTLRKG
ncbi:MAG TPA: hypothetical protein VGM88_32530 [Kofleriaceae bacterium]|jgi:hypothetical protein